MISSSTPTYVVITVDVEGLRGDQPLKNLILGDLPSGNYGIGRIMDICDKHHVKATFFVDVYEAARHGEEAMAAVCREIHERGHDVQLHAHPDQAYDPTRRHMTNYSLEEQTRIIRDGINMLERWIGKRPVAFRAGGYGADSHTLEALRRNGILVDASMFYQRAGCGLNGVVDTRNKVVDHEGILEVPVTVYQSISLGCIQRYEKIDIDGCATRELEWAFRALRDSGVKLIVLFLHSHTFIRRNHEHTRFTPDLADILKFDRLLARLSRDSRFRFITIQDVADLRHEVLLEGTDACPVYPNWIYAWLQTFRRAVRASRTSRRARVFAAGSVLLGLTVLLALGVALWVSLHR